jgi:asparagine synthase (glutamine-hydrolysing)
VCGIVGFSRPGPEAYAELKSMMASLRHRGPDQDGLHVDPGCALGHTRLIVIEPRGGRQPRVDAASGDALVFNGEIYGYRELLAELRRDGVELADESDTEVLFALIRRDGVEPTLARVDGMFAFAFREGATGRIVMARDRFGEKPLYFGISDGRLLFASEPRALLRHPALAAAEIDPRRFTGI